MSSRDDHRAQLHASDRHASNQFTPILCVFPLVVFFLVALVYPFANMAFQGSVPALDILSVTADSLRNTPWRGFTLDNYLSVFTDAHLRSTLILSLAISAIISVGSIALCLGPAWLLVRTEFPGKRLFRAILTVPMAFSGVIIGFLTVIMIGRVGAIPQISQRLFGVPLLESYAYSFTGLGIAYLWFQIPRATLTLEAGIRKFNWDLVDAARSLGASPFQAFCRVLLPLLTPAISSTAAVTFAVSMGSFGVALLLLKKASVLPVEIYSNVFANLAFEAAAAQSVLLAVITVGINYTLRRISNKYQELG